MRDLLGMLAFLLALAGQVAPGMAVPDADQGHDSILLRAATVLCSGDVVPAPPSQSGHHRHDTTLCPFCFASALPAPLLAGAPVLPLPRGTSFARAALPLPARAPPPHAVGAALPRGPPTLA